MAVSYKKPEGLPFVEILDDYHNQMAIRNLLTGVLIAIELRGNDSKRVKRWLKGSLDFCKKSENTLERLIKDENPTVDNFLSKVFIDLAITDNEKIDTRRLLTYKKNFAGTFNVLQQIQRKKEPKDVENSKSFLKSFIEEVKVTYMKTETLYFGYLSPR